MFRVRKQVNFDEKQYYKYCKYNVTIAFLDTGIGYHPDLIIDGRLLAFKDFVNGRNIAYDDCGHGTHVCGIACGDGTVSNGDFKGIAPRSYMIVAKVLDQNGDGKTEDMINGLNWIVLNQKKYGIRILNISVSIGKLRDKEKEIKLINALRKVCECGIIVVCAAGNEGPLEGSISKLGLLEDVITVGCHDGNYGMNYKKCCDFYSGRGNSLERIKKPNIVAPGTDIISCNVNCYKTKKGYINGYVKKSGTSMSTPIVSGAIALLLQKEPLSSVDKIKQKLFESADDLGEHWTKQGFGMLNIKKLMED